MLHSWDVTPSEAVAIQQSLRSKVQLTNVFDPQQIRTVAGIDASYKDVGHAAVVVLSFPDLQLIEQVTATRAISFPYVPGLLSFREAPVVLDAIAKLTHQPDVMIFDGQGIAHPRRLGIAAHIGVYLDRPTIGCAKSRLVGTYQEPGPEKGDYSPLLEHDGEVIGAVLRTKQNTKPLFISPGHKIDLKTSVWLVLNCVKNYRLPETTRLADYIAGLSDAEDREE
jgi:deoxyribonuclease V